MDRRNRVADIAADVEGNVQANVGARVFVVAEELNAMMKRLRGYWRRERGPGDPVRSPALDALDEILFTGPPAPPPVSVPEPLGLAAACEMGIVPKKLAAARNARHTGDPRLTMAVGAAAVRPTRAAWTWDRHAYAAEVLQAATWALHAREHGKSPHDILRSVA